MIEPRHIKALKRLRDGKPLFATPAKTALSAQLRRQTVQQLFRAGLIRRGKWGPELTNAGLEQLPWRRPGGQPKYTERERAAVVFLLGQYSAGALAERIGAPSAKAVRQLAYRTRKRLTHTESVNSVNADGAPVNSSPSCGVGRTA